MKNLTPEMIEKAKTAKSAEELLEIAKANGAEMTAEEAATYFAQLNPKSGELDDDDLDNVAGGACKILSDKNNDVFSAGDKVRTSWACYCGNYTGVIEKTRTDDGCHGLFKVRCDKCNRTYGDTYTTNDNWISKVEIIG